MLIIDYDRQLTLFAPGKCGSTALAYNLQHLTTEPNEFFRAQRLKVISSNTIPAQIQDLLENKEFYYSLPIADSYLMFRKLYTQPNFKHYVFCRDPVDRRVSAFETLISWFLPDMWEKYHNNEVTLEELWSQACELTDYDYHAGHYLNKIKNLDCVFTDIKNINNIIQEHYNIKAKHVPSVPFWTKGIDLESRKYTDYTRESDPEQWDKTQLEITRFRSECAVKYNTLLKNNKLDIEVELYNSLDIS